ncbi:MAG: DUF3515 domain-containing protein [Cellulomonadaceae bacterium]
MPHPSLPRPLRAPRSLRILAGAGAAAGALLLLGGCAPTVSVPVAPHAADPVCAQIVLAVPDQLGALPKIATASQATAAWGPQDQAITLRCGVEVPGPTTDRCQAVTDASGLEVDWLVVETDDGGWRFTTYGRSPAVEVTVPPETSTSPVDLLNRAVSAAEQTRRCY